MNLYTFGRTIYIDKVTGVIIHNTGEVSTTIPDYEEVRDDWNTVESLSERIRDTVIVIKLEVGEHQEEFNSKILGRVNPETLELEFYYPDPSDPEPEVPVYQAPLSEQVKLLQAQNTALSERSDFIEDVIAEIAMQMYS